MFYLKAYFSAFAQLFKLSGAIFLALSLLRLDSAMALWLLYLVVTVSIAGPIKASVSRGSLG